MLANFKQNILLSATLNKITICKLFVILFCELQVLVCLPGWMDRFCTTEPKIKADLYGSLVTSRGTNRLDVVID